MTTALERKADAFITKLAISLAGSVTSTTQSTISAHFEHTVQSLPNSALRSHLLSSLPIYTTQLLHHYTQHLPTPPPPSTSPTLFTSEAFDVALSTGLTGSDVSADVALCERLLACSNCPSTVVTTYFRLQLSLLPGAPLSLPALHRALSLHRRTAALMAGLDACVEWAESQTSQQPSPCEWLSTTIDRLTSLLTTHARTVVDSSTTGMNAVLNRLCRLLLLGVVWRAEASSLSSYVGHATRTLAVWEQPPSAVNVDAQLLFLCQWCALLNASDDEQQPSAAVSTSYWLAASRLPAVLAAALPGVVRALPLSSVNTRSVAFVRLAILHSILPSPASDLLLSHLSPIASMPLPSTLVALWPSQGKAGRAVQPSVEHWVTRAKDAVSERTLLQQLTALGAVGSEVVASTSGAEGAVKPAVVSAGQEEAELEEAAEGYGWFDDRRGESHEDALDGQLHSLIAELRDEGASNESEEVVDSAVSGLLQQTGEDQPIAAEQQAFAQQEDPDKAADDEQPLSLSLEVAAAETSGAEESEGQDGTKVSRAMVEETPVSEELPPPAAASTRAKKRAKTATTSVRVSPRHTRSGTKL